MSLSDGIAVEQRSTPAVNAGVGAAVSRPYCEKIRVVPVRYDIGSSNRVLELAYRVFEILLAGIALIVAVPIMLIEAVLIRLDSPGPVLFFQIRLGRSEIRRGRDLEGRTDFLPPPGGYEPDGLYYVPTYFRFVKFRSMYSDARQRFPELFSYSYGPGELHCRLTADVNDPRLTRVGRVLRKLSLDELPNLWCVLCGHIRLVGPRPEAAEFVQHYTPEEMYKFAVKPGITGLFQTNGRGLLTWGEQLAWDLRYVRTRSVWLDLKIILLTLKLVIKRHGAF
jgi:lipopolysaccharide/colanic/teichoic acid biosynthesis glycosyltransferase